MKISDLTKRHLFGSIDKSKIPGTLTDYNCQLVIQQYQNGLIKPYLKFTSKPSLRKEPFNIIIQKLSQPKNLIYSYKLAQKQGSSPSVVIGDRQQFKVQSTIKVQKKETEEIDEMSESASEFYQQEQIELRHLEFMNEYSDDQQQFESKFIQSSQNDKTSIKGLLIQYLNNENNRKSKLKDIKMYLMNHNVKIAETKLKGFLNQLCQPNVDKKLGYCLKDQFIEQDYQKAPRKIIKQQ